MITSLASKLKNGVRLAPPVIIYIYIIFGLLDLLTTWMATPDLKLEGNWIVRLFNLSWTGLLINAFINYVFVITVLIIALDYLQQYFKTGYVVSFKELMRKSFKSARLFLCIIALGMFYSSLLSVGHVIPNNYLGYLYQQEAESWYRNISVWYIERQKFFVFYIQFIIVIPGYIIALLRINNIRKKTFQS